MAEAIVNLDVREGGVYIMQPRAARPAGKGGEPPAIPAGGYVVIDPENPAVPLVTLNAGETLNLAGAGGGMLVIQPNGSDVPRISSASNNNTIDGSRTSNTSLPLARITGGSVAMPVAPAELVRLTSPGRGRYTVAARDNIVSNDPVTGMQTVTLSGVSSKGLSTDAGRRIEVADGATLRMFDPEQTSPVPLPGGETIPVRVGAETTNNLQLLTIVGGNANSNDNRARAALASGRAAPTVADALNVNNVPPDVQQAMNTVQADQAREAQAKEQAQAQAKAQARAQHQAQHRAQAQVAQTAQARAFAQAAQAQARMQAQARLAFTPFVTRRLGGGFGSHRPGSGPLGGAPYFPGGGGTHRPGSGPMGGAPFAPGGGGARRPGAGPLGGAPFAPGGGGFHRAPAPAGQPAGGAGPHGGGGGFHRDGAGPLGGAPAGGPGGGGFRRDGAGPLGGAPGAGGAPAPGGAGGAPAPGGAGGAPAPGAGAAPAAAPGEVFDNYSRDILGPKLRGQGLPENMRPGTIQVVPLPVAPSVANPFVASVSDMTPDALSVALAAVAGIGPQQGRRSDFSTLELPATLNLSDIQRQV